MDAEQLIELTTTTWNDRDRAGYHAAYHEDCEITAPGFVGKGQHGVSEFWSCFMDAFPDNRVRLVHAVGGARDVGAEESVFEGTHTGVLVSSDGSEIPPKAGGCQPGSPPSTPPATANWSARTSTSTCSISSPSSGSWQARRPAESSGI